MHGLTARVVTLAGAGSAVLTVAADMVIGPNPDSSASPSTLADYYSAHHQHILVAGTIFGYAAILFGVFGIVLWSRIRQTVVHPAIAAAALVGVAIATFTELADASGWYVLGELGDKSTISPATIQTLHLSVTTGGTAGSAGSAALLVAYAVAGLKTKAFPRWLAWPAIAIAVVELAPTPGLIGFFTSFAFLAWMFVTSIVMLRQSPGTGSARVRGRSADTLPDPA